MDRAPTAAAIDRLFLDYGDVWPPRGDFSEWPSAWIPYMEICDEMPRVLAVNEDPETTREWITLKISQVNISNVMEEVNRRLRKSDRKLLGFAACLAFVKSGYRWGTLPVVTSERERTVLEFPENLTRPFHPIMDMHGLSRHTNFFILHYANCVYDDAIHDHVSHSRTINVDDQKPPQTVRFRFNHDPAIFAIEQEFAVKTLCMELQFAPALRAASEFLQLTAEAEASTRAAGHNLKRRCELLDVMKVSITRALKEFVVFTTWPEDKRRKWTGRVQAMMAWGIDGEMGTSGAETLIASFIDAFFHVPGQCLVFKAKHANYSNMAESAVNVLDAIKIDDPGSRFRTFTGERGPLEEDPIYRRRAAVLRLFHMWRLSHAAVASRIVSSSEGLASGRQNVIKGKPTLADSVKNALKERANETKDAYKKCKRDGNVCMIDTYWTYFEAFITTFAIELFRVFW